MSEFDIYYSPYGAQAGQTSSEARYGSIVEFKLKDVVWQVKYDGSPTPTKPGITDDIQYARIRDDIIERHDVRRENNGQDERHILTQLFFQTHWPEITLLVNPPLSRTYTPFCLPEILLKNGKNALPDIVGIDSNGTVWIVEISSKSRVPDTARQVKIASQVLGNIPVSGIAARYKFSRRGDSASIYLQVV